MIGVEFDSVRQSIASAIVAEARKHGLLLMTAGRTQIVRLLPPLVSAVMACVLDVQIDMSNVGRKSCLLVCLQVISKQDVKIALDAFRLACESVSKA